jgi:hypothetical protein
VDVPRLPQLDLVAEQVPEPLALGAVLVLPGADCPGQLLGGPALVTVQRLEQAVGDRPLAFEESLAEAPDGLREKALEVRHRPGRSSYTRSPTHGRDVVAQFGGSRNRIRPMRRPSLT